MSYRDTYIAERTLVLQESAARRRAEYRRMLREAGIGQRPWLSQQGCWLLCRLGHLLVAVGRRLEQSGPAEPLLAKG